MISGDSGLVFDVLAWMSVSVMEEEREGHRQAMFLRLNMVFFVMGLTWRSKERV